MADYGSITIVEVLAWGVANSDYDTKATAALTIASDLIDAEYNNINRIASPSSLVNSAANLIATAILTSGPTELTKNSFYIQGMQIIKDSRGNQTTDGEWAYSYSVLRS